MKKGISSDIDTSKILPFLRDNNNLRTQVEILKSPSVLMPVFEFVKENKNKNGNLNENYGFLNWRKDNLKVSLLQRPQIF